MLQAPPSRDVPSATSTVASEVPGPDLDDDDTEFHMVDLSDDRDDAPEPPEPPEQVAGAPHSASTVETALQRDAVSEVCDKAHPRFLTHSYNCHSG